MVPVESARRDPINLLNLLRRFKNLSTQDKYLLDKEGNAEAISRA